MALRTTYISCVARLSWLRAIFSVSRELTSGESDRLLPGRTVSIGSDRDCLSTSSPPLAPFNILLPLPLIKRLVPISGFGRNRTQSACQWKQLDSGGCIGHVCHHVGNRSQIFHLPLRLVSRCFLAAPRDQSVRGWPIRRAELLCDRGTTGEFQLLSSLFMPGSSSSVCFVVPSVLVVTVDYFWCGRQDQGAFGYRTPRIWICKMVHSPMSCRLSSFFGCIFKVSWVI